MVTHEEMQYLVQQRHGFLPSRSWIDQCKLICGLVPWDEDLVRRAHADPCPPQHKAAIVAAFRHCGLVQGDVGLYIYGLHDGQTLCRYISLRDLMWWAETGTTWLTRVESWPDTWEIPYRQVAGENKLSHDAATFSRDIYAQCWCQSVPDDEFCSSPDCDAMWSKYSPDRNGLLIQTTVARVRNCYTDRFDRAVLAPVEYNSEEDILTGLFAGPQGLMELSVAYAKRAAFAYEHEVRLATWKPYVWNTEKESKDRIAVAVDPRRLITGIETDPRADESYAELVRTYCDRIGFDLNRTTVEKSRLYSDRP